MKTNIIKGGKRALGLLLAVCILAVSLFTANIGVNINVDAAVTETNSDVWDGNLTKPTEKDNSGTYIIRTAEEFAWVALSSQHTTEANYKVADGIKYFNMNGKKGITFNSTAADVEAAELTGTKWANGETNNPNFKGTIDGNGVIIFNIYATGAYAALFPYIINAGANDSPRATATFKNINVTSSYFTAYHAVGGIVGFDPGYPTSLTIDGCSVTNCCLINHGMSDGTKSVIGGIAGDVDHNRTIVNNCFVGGNKMVADKIVSGFVGNSTGNASVTISNSICIDALPYATKVATTEPNTKVTTGATYTNVYTNSNFDSATYTTVKNVVSGQDAINQMQLDFNGTWFANTTTYPTPRALHSFNTTYNDKGTHNEKCADCGLVGVPVPHFYNIKDEVYKKSYCACGAYIDGLFDVWDAQGAIDSDFEGKGTEEKPYIINTVEELYGMVRSTGLNANGEANYYKVADGVARLYINDTRAMSQSDFVSAASAGSLYNWSTGYKTDTDVCGCGTTHKNACADYFGGKFDGNGATIYGLYSYTTHSAYWASGSGFVPMLTGDAIIKNVVFDTSYVKNTGGYIGVITASNGAWNAQYSSATCDVLSKLKLPGDCSATIMNTVVRNAHLNTTASALDDNTYAYVGGFAGFCLEPHVINFINCLYDGTNSTITTTATSTEKYAGIYSTRQGYTADSWVEGCLVVNGASTTMDVVIATRWAQATTDFSHNSYAYGSTAANATLGTFKADGYTTVDALPLLNWTAWDIDAVDTYGTPMPKLVEGWEVKNFRYYKDAFKNSEYYANPEGASPADEGYEQGVFSDFDELVGSGTEADPYIIDNAELLFEIIASGGTNRGIGQYFKLACDLDLGGIQWVNYQTDADRNDEYNKVYYQYKAFAGTIDGDGHTITGMYNANANSGEYAGFIPELAATGKVKNLHFRDSYAYSATGCGIIAGTAASGAMIEGCSIEGGVADQFVGIGSPTITNSYCGSVSDVEGTVFDGTNYDTAVWYKGGAEGDTYKLLNKALAMPCADIDGDGEGYEYSTNDLSALKQKLLREPAYANVYGDVSRNGKTDIRDMVILQREVADDDIDVLDGFWKNVKEGNFSIWYDENDNLDFARKMELYLEEVTGVDIAKTKGTTTANLTIRIVTNADLGANNYSVTYDLETGVLTISGGSFTAVEQGVLAFIDGSNAVTGVVYTGTGAIDPYKTAVTLGNQTYHYVWGDEFDEAVNGTVSYDKWLLRNKGTDETPDIADSEYEGIRSATDAEAPLINAVTSDGKLVLKRGILKSGDEGYSQGYRTYASGISSKNSLLYKQGYAEMLVTLPSDGYAFPAWWLLTSPAVYNNYAIQRSLYGKVYELNDKGTYKFDGTTSAFSADDPTTFQYKLPTQTLEIDIFEIIQKPSYSNVLGVVQSTDYDVCFNIHKWYSHATVKDDTTLTVYDLDWDNLETNGGFNKLLTATGSNGENYAGTQTTGYSTHDKIYVHTENLADGQANGSITYQGSKSNTSVEPGGVAGNSMNVNMRKYRSNSQVRQLKYGLLWTENDMTFSIYDGSSLVYSTTVNKAAMNYNNAESYSAGNYGFDQYAYMLIENHWYTAAQQSNGTWHYASIQECDMEIEYVRLYQLNDHRDIVTPETEAFNSNNRFGN